MTKHERKAMAAGKKVALALWAIEDYDGDPDDVLKETGYWLRQMGGHNQSGPYNALLALIDHYSEEKES